MIDANVLKSMVPKTQRHMITDDLVKKLNDWDTDPKLVGSFRENMLSYIGVLKEGRYKIEDYTYAVKFVSYKLIGHNDIDAYAITFPERYDRLITEGLSRPEIGPYVTAYKKNKLVNAIFEQTIVPSHVLNAPLYQEALNELAQIMVHGRSEMARVNAANAILGATKPPETKKFELDIGVKESSAIQDLNEQLGDIAAKQLKLIEEGKVDMKTLGTLKPKEEIIDVEEVND